MLKNRLLEFISSVLLIVMSSCYYPISPGIRQKTESDLTFSKVLSTPPSYHGTVVIWGGVIIKVVTQPEETRLYLWETPLEFGERPKGKEFAEGMFIARSPQNLDPRIYAEGRKITVAGEIIGEELERSDTVPYVYPVVMVKELYLWKTEAPTGYKWSWGNTPYYWPEAYSPDIPYSPVR